VSEATRPPRQPQAEPEKKPPSRLPPRQNPSSFCFSLCGPPFPAFDPSLVKDARDPQGDSQPLLYRPGWPHSARWVAVFQTRWLSVRSASSQPRPETHFSSRGATSGLAMLHPEPQNETEPGLETCISPFATVGGGPGKSMSIWLAKPGCVRHPLKRVYP
jgi:hypothetical protein